MNARNHAHEAEVLLAQAKKIHQAAEKASAENGGLPPHMHAGIMAEAGLLTAMAQVHATLATRS